jgi:ADP-ribosyl-[dinitrogen reductase] hydrolase
MVSDFDSTQSFNRCQNMLLGVAIGDAFAYPYEFASKEIEWFEKNLDMTKYCVHPKPEFGHQILGLYTDDTQMSIAVTELLISSGKENGDKFTKENLADYFVKTFKRDSINGYARGFQNFLKSVNDGQEFLQKIKPTSTRNGAAMRSVPLGVVADLDMLVDYAQINASTTHDTPKGHASSVAVALLSHMQFYHVDLKDVDFFDRILAIDKRTAVHLRTVSRMNGYDQRIINGRRYKDRGIPCDAMRTTGAVFYLLNYFHEPSSVLEEAIKLGGDTDSVASIGLGLTMIDEQLCNLPSFLYDDLTDHKFGKNYLKDLGQELENTFFF